MTVHAYGKTSIQARDSGLLHNIITSDTPSCPRSLRNVGSGYKARNNVTLALYPDTTLRNDLGVVLTPDVT